MCKFGSPPLDKYPLNRKKKFELRMSTALDTVWEIFMMPILDKKSLFSLNSKLEYRVFVDQIVDKNHEIV